MKKIVIGIRHAESIGNRGGRTESPESNPLSSYGIRQAARFAQAITEPPELIVVSRYIRTRQTAQPIMDRFPSTRIEIWDHTHELCILSPKKCANTTQREREVPRNAYWEACEPCGRHGDDAETFQEFITRIEQTLERLHSHKAKSIMLVTHEQFLLGINFLRKKSEPKPFKSLSAEEQKELMQRFYNLSSTQRIENCLARDLTHHVS